MRWEGFAPVHAVVGRCGCSGWAIVGPSGASEEEELQVPSDEPDPKKQPASP